MRAYPRTSGMFVIVLALTLSLKAIAADDTSAQEGGKVTVTFRLILKGDVPEDETITLLVRRVQDGQLSSGPLPPALCGFDSSTNLSGEECQGNGTSYETRVEVPPGTTLTYYFQRRPTTAAGDVFGRGTRTFTENATITASYAFSAAANEPPVPELPNTGVGRMSGGAGLLLCAPAAPRTQLRRSFGGWTATVA